MRQRKGIAFKKHFSARATRPRGLPSFARRSKNTTKAVASLVFSTPPLSTVKSCDNFVGDARRKKHATRPVKRRAVAIGASFYIARREKRTSFFNRDIKAHHRVVYYVSLRGKNEGVLGPCVRLHKGRAFFFWGGGILRLGFYIHSTQLNSIACAFDCSTQTRERETRERERETKTDFLRRREIENEGRSSSKKRYHYHYSSSFRWIYKKRNALQKERRRLWTTTIRLPVGGLGEAFLCASSR